MRSKLQIQKDKGSRKYSVSHISAITICASKELTLSALTMATVRAASSKVIKAETFIFVFSCESRILKTSFSREIVRFVMGMGKPRKKHSSKDLAKD